jgi:hypothetical protein
MIIIDGNDMVVGIEENIAIDSNKITGNNSEYWNCKALDINDSTVKIGQIHESGVFSDVVTGISDNNKFVSLRSQRNYLLGVTDFHALSDVEMSEEMATYRQALRDLPETVDIYNPVYPEKP